MPTRDPTATRARPALVGAVLACASPGAAAQSVVSADRLVQLGLGLVLVLVLIGATAFALRRVLRIETSGTGPLRVVAGLSMGTRERLVLVDADGCRVLLGVVPGRIQTLHVLGESPAGVPGESSPQARRSRRFASMLHDAKEGGGGGA